MALPRIARQLHADHVNMGKLLDLLDAQLGRLEDGGAIDYLLAMDVATYMTEYPDVYHHPKEDLLFSRWQEREPAASDTVAELALEHKSIARSGIHLLELLRAAAADVVMRRADLIEAGRQYIDSQREHIRKEEREVFPQASSVLLDSDWEEIDQLLATPDDPLFGKKVGDSFRLRYQQIRQLVEAQEY